MRKNISFMLAILIIISTLLLVSCYKEDITPSIVAGKTNYAECYRYKADYNHLNHVSYAIEFDVGGYVVNVEKLNDNFYFIQFVYPDGYYNRETYTEIALVHKDLIVWSYHSDDTIQERFNTTYKDLIDNQYIYTIDEMKTLLCEDAEYTISSIEDYLVLKFDDGDIKYYNSPILFSGISKYIRNK